MKIKFFGSGFNEREKWCCAGTLDGFYFEAEQGEKYPQFQLDVDSQINTPPIIQELVKVIQKRHYEDVWSMVINEVKLHAE